MKKITYLVICFLAAFMLQGCDTQSNRDKSFVKLMKISEYQNFQRYISEPNSISPDNRERIKKDLAEPKRIANIISNNAKFIAGGYGLGGWDTENFIGKMYVFSPSKLKNRRIIVSTAAFPLENHTKWDEYLEYRASNIRLLPLNDEGVEVEEDGVLYRKSEKVLYLKGKTTYSNRSTPFMNVIYLDKEFSQFTQVRYYSDYKFSAEEVIAFERFVQTITK